MTKREWQEKHGFDDEDMARIQDMLDVFGRGPGDLKVFNEPFKERFKKKVVDLS